MTPRYLLCACVLVATPGFSRQDPILCGTHAATWQEQLHLHRQSVKALARQTRGLSRPVEAARDAGDIAILPDDGGVISRLNRFDLDRRTISFLPAGNGAASYRFSLGGDTYDATAAANGSTLTGLGDDDSRSVDLPFSFPFFGQSYRSLFVNSDGNLTFGRGDNASNDRSLGNLLGGPPRIGGLYRDLDPTRAPGAVRVLGEAERFVVSWAQVREYSDSNSGRIQTFQIRLFPDGRIEFAYSGVSTDDAVVGIAPGGSQGDVAMVSFADDVSAEYTAAVAETFSARVQIDLAAAAQRFYKTHDDAYDYLVFLNNEGITAANAVAFESTVRNNRSGYGDKPIDEGAQYGSPSRLQAVINLGPLAQYPLNPASLVPARSVTGDTPVTVIAHEAGHLFLAFASVRDPLDPEARPMLGFQRAHWKFTFNSEASLLEGNRIADAGSGMTPRFTTVATVEGYAPLDQYLMGFRAPEEVPPTFLVTGTGLFDQAPRRGVSFDGQRQDISVQDIIAAEGRRTPDHTVAQRHFRFAFVLVAPAGGDPSASDVQQVDVYRREFEAFFSKAASDRATADATLRKSLRFSAFPAAGVVAGMNAPASLSVARPSAAPLVITLRTSSGAVAAPREVTIPAGQTQVSFPINGLQPGVGEITAEPVDAAFETAFAKVQVAAGPMLRLNLEARDGATGVRVTDANELPYAGLRVNLATPNGNFESLTGADGRAAFPTAVSAGDRVSAALPDVPEAPLLETTAE